MARAELFYDRKRKAIQPQIDLLMGDRKLYRNKKCLLLTRKKNGIPEPFKLPVTSRRSKNDFPSFLFSLYAHEEHPVKTSSSKTARQRLRGRESSIAAEAAIRRQTLFSNRSGLAVRDVSTSDSTHRGKI